MSWADDSAQDAATGRSVDEGRTGRFADSGCPSGSVYDWYVRGLALLSSGDPAAASQLLAWAAHGEPGSRSIREALARALYDAGRYAEARDSFAALVAADPVDDYALFGYGLAAGKVGDYRDAVEHLALAAAMRPDLAHYVRALHRARALLAAR